MTAWALQHDPVAGPKNVVIAGQVRFTVLTPAMIRMEWSPDGRFEDRASQAFIHRRVTPQAFRRSETDGWLTVLTDELILRYRKDGGRFAADNLTVELRLGGKPVVWRPGTKDVGNLHGTYRTLDAVAGSHPLEPGLLSRDGWVVVDDSKSLVFDGDPPWITPRRSKDAVDWYFFGYGHDYKRALKDFTTVAGRVPMPPRFAFGAWWSRYWAYSADELRDLVAQFREHHVPLDVLVVDMDWHLPGWTGYTWNPEDFPDPDGFLKWVHEQGVKVTLNLHPADGVRKHEQAFPAVARAMRLNPAKIDHVPFDCTDRRFVDAYFKHLHHPLEKQGVDFWWLDWQQGTDTKLPGLDPLWWLNHLHWSDMERNPEQHGRRPLLFSRWGGLGNHRYQIGFSGDTHSVWKSLAFQPYFTSTAGNVGYGYWSHDIGGHFPGPVDPELYVRWIQWGVFSPILRTHTTKHPDAERRIWAFEPEYFEAARQAFHLRYELIPYIYTAARQCYDTGLPLCRPLYYEWPELDEAYTHGGEYLFGDSLLVAPVTEPMDPISRCAHVEVWLPPGEWTHWFSGRTYQGPRMVPLLVPLDEIPIFVRSGGIIPTAAYARNTGEQTGDVLYINIFPGERGETRIYEDDGASVDYQRDRCAWVPVSHRSYGGNRVVSIGPVLGHSQLSPASRTFNVRVFDSPNIGAVLVNNEPLERLPEDQIVQAPQSSSWQYSLACDGPAIHLQSIDSTRSVEIVLEGPRDVVRQRFPGGFRGVLNEIRSAARRPDGPTSLPSQFALEDSLGVNLKGLRWHRGGHYDEHELRTMALDYIKSTARDVDADEKRVRQVGIRTLGVSYRVNVSPHGASAGNALTAEVRVCSTLPPEVVKGVAARIELSVTESWQMDGPREWSAADLSVEREVLAQVTLVPKSLPDTGLLQGRILVEQDKTAFDIPIRRLILPSINTWHIVGPFDAPAGDALAKVGSPEKKIDLGATYAGKGGRKVKWRRIQRPLAPETDVADEFCVDLNQVFGGRVQNAGAYAVAYLDSPDERPATLAIGSDDGVVVWLNNKEVHRAPAPRPYTSKQDRVPVTLRAGANVLLLKIAQGAGGWQFAVHVETAEGEPMTDVTVRLPS